MKPVLMFLFAGALGAQQPTPPTVRATAEAVVSAKPDRARVNLGVVTTAPTAREAGAQNAKQLEQVLESLRKVLGPSVEIKTAGYYMHPEYDYRQPPDGNSRLRGYTAGNTVQVTTNDLAAVGRIIDTATQSGANTVQSLEFLLKDDRAVRLQALREAATQARINADTMAVALGLQVKRVVTVEQHEGGAPIRPMENVAMFAKGAETPVAPGRLVVRASVTVTVAVE